MTWTWWIAVLALLGPLLALAMAGTQLSVWWRDRTEGRRRLAALEARHGQLAGRVGTLARETRDGEFPLPDGAVRWRVRLEGLDLDLWAVDAEAPADGAAVRIESVRPLRAGEVPFVDHGVGVRVVPTDHAGSR